MTDFEQIGADLTDIEDMFRALKNQLNAPYHYALRLGNSISVPPRRKLVFRPDLSRCRMATAFDNAPCKQPATRPDGLCPAHFKKFHGHVFKWKGYSGRFCTYCDKPETDGMNTEYCPARMELNQ